MRNEIKIEMSGKLCLWSQGRGCSDVVTIGENEIESSIREALGLDPLVGIDRPLGECELMLKILPLKTTAPTVVPS